METVAVGIRFGLAALFLVSGAAKVRRLAEFEGAVLAYQLVPRRLARHTARSVALLEVAVGVTLALGVWVRASAVLAVLLLGVMTSAMAVNLQRGRRIECGCLGAAEHERISWRLVGRNVLLALAASLLAPGPATALSLEHEATTLTSTETWALALPALALPVFALVLATGARAMRSGRNILRGTS